MRQTLEQRRAAYAWDQVSALKSKTDIDGYLDVARKFPAMVQTNGLGPSVAFLESKGKGAHKQLITHLTAWLCRDNGAPGLPIYGESAQGETLAARIARHDSLRLRLATAETLALAVWLKRFAEAREEKK